MGHRVHVALCLLATMLVVASCSDETPKPATSPSPAGASPTATWTPAPEPTPTLHAQPPTPVEFTVGEPRALPPGVVLFIAHGCWGCDGPDGNIERLYTDASGNLRSDPIGIRAEYTLSRPQFARDGTGWMAICAGGYCGGLGGPEPGSRAALLRSVDGGVTWESIAEFEDSWIGVVGTISGEVVLAMAGPQAEPELQATTDYFVHPSGIPVRPPVTYEPREVAPFVWRDEIWWRHWDTSRLVNHDGSAEIDLLALWEDRVPGSRIRVLGTLGSTSLLLAADEPDGYALLRYTEGRIWDLLTIDGPIGFNLATRVNDAVGFGNLYSSVNDLRRALQEAGSSYVVVESLDSGWQHSLPAMFDFTTGIAHPLELYGPLIGENYLSRNDVFHAIEGSFLRIETGNADCLNVREHPSLDAPVVACHVNGVLLADLGESVESEAGTWQKVATPMGEQGWASAQFLLR